jgi:hydrogenase maturation protease
VGERRVIAVGNRLRRDDGAGAAVLERLRGRLPAGVALVEVGGEPSELLDAWEGAASAVVVDAVRTGAEPGSLHRFDASGEPLPARTGSASTHGLGLAEALELGRALGRLPARVVVVGIEAGDEGQGAGLSEPVAAAVDGAAALVLEELGDA